jgi:hypothetical protein
MSVINDPILAQGEAWKAHLARQTMNVPVEPKIEIPTQPTIADEVPQTSTVEGVTDEEIVETALSLLKSGKTRPQIKTALLGEFDGVEHDADELIDRAYEKEIEAAQASEDYAISVAADATDKRLEAEHEARKQLVEKVYEQGRLGKLVDPDDMRWVQGIRDAEEKEAEQEETFDEQTEERFPECPIFSGALTDLAGALYPSLPLEFKQWGMIVRWGVMRSGLDRLENEPHLQPRFYTVLVSPPNRGKTASIKESYSAINDVVKAAKAKTADNKKVRSFADVEALPSADSGPFLVQELFNVAKEANKQYIDSICSDDRAKILLDPDELSDVFEKARTSVGRVSTLFIELLKLHSNNRTGNGTKQNGNRSVDNAHLAVLAGTTTKKYPMLWTGTGGGVDGLVSRFLAITTNSEQVPPVQLPSDFMAAKIATDKLAHLAHLPGQTIRLSKEATQRLTEWWLGFDNGKESATRILEAVKQLLIVLAVTNAPDGHGGTELTVGVELVEQAIRFADYEIAVRERLNPGDSWTHVQAMENQIIAWARKHTARRNPKSRNDFRRGIHPQRMPGGLGTFRYAWDNCVNTGVLKVREQNQRGARYSL